MFSIITSFIDCHYCPNFLINLQNNFLNCVSFIICHYCQNILNFKIIFLFVSAFKLLLLPLLYTILKTIFYFPLLKVHHPTVKFVFCLPIAHFFVSSVILFFSFKTCDARFKTRDSTFQSL